MPVGFFGKLPSHGDFLRQRVSDAFVDSWDAWLRDCLAASRTALGPNWLNVYLTSPAWRFVCAAGVCGPAPLVGLLAPSVDRVGRYFPLTVVAELSAETRLLCAAANASRFFERAERLVIETLAAERIDFERFSRGVAGLEDELPIIEGSHGLVFEAAALGITQERGQSWRLPIGAASHLPAAFQQLFSLQLEAAYRPLGLWWSDGSTAVDPSCLITRGLPVAEQFTALLDGAWAEHQWSPVPAQVTDEPTLPGTPIDELDQQLSFRSAAATDVGKARGNNEDGFIERSEVGLWAVADGMGGHSHGEVASRMVCDALAAFVPDGTFDDLVAAASQRVREVNDHLMRRAATDADSSGSTVVVLLLRGARSAVLWAGDSRVYRWRSGVLEQLSRDHSLAALGGPGALESSVITRAVGVQPDLALDQHWDTVRPADRFLLCSDGLTRVVPDAQICALMEAGDVRAVVDGLIKATLDAGAPDNVTVLVAEAYREEMPPGQGLGI